MDVGPDARACKSSDAESAISHPVKVTLGHAELPVLARSR